jgi:hypothetical protein
MHLAQVKVTVKVNLDQAKKAQSSTGIALLFM